MSGEGGNISNEDEACDEESSNHNENLENEEAKGNMHTIEANDKETDDDASESKNSEVPSSDRGSDDVRNKGQWKKY